VISIYRRSRKRIVLFLMRGGNGSQVRDMQSTDGHKKGDVRRVCVVCAREFWGNAMQRYCSSECRIKGQKALAKEYYLAVRKKKRVKTKCLVCGKEFECKIKERALYCSRACRDKAFKQRRKAGATDVIDGWVNNGEDESGSLELLMEFSKGKV